MPPEAATTFIDMSSTTAADQDQQDSADEQPEPACGISLRGKGSDWTDESTAAFPPGYPRLCSHDECFGDIDMDDEGFAPHYDHREELDRFVRTTGSANSTKRRHVPATEERDD